ncbi:MAG: panthothenate synthetase [Acidobacteria bacterium]|nr:panthothenate synthetase [Acidobacteriota bacterium]
MRMLLHVKIPHETFNAAVKDGTAGKKVQRILDELKPEAVYFTEYEGRRGAILIINMAEPSKVPTFAEPWFLQFNADCQFHIVMTPEDLAKAGLDELGKKWA